MKRRDKGFTIIELIVVMAIIGILAGLITVAAQTARKQALIAKAKATISSIETALGMLQADLGAYPSQDVGGTTTVNLINALSTSNANIYVGTTDVAINSANWNGPYMQFRTNEISGGSLIDPWGSNYGYNNPGSNHGTGANHSSYVDIWSNGPNKTDQHTLTPPGDDITNWTR